MFHVTIEFGDLKNIANRCLMKRIISFIRNFEFMPLISLSSDRISTI